MKKQLSKILPLYTLIPLISAFTLNTLIYSGSMSICKNWHHYDFTSTLDRMVPVIPEWVYIYLGCYLFWVINYILVARIHKDDPDGFYRYITTDMMSRIVCGLFYFGLPTTNVRPEIIGSGFAEHLLRWVYAIDQPANLFPSIHCMASWFCFIGVRADRRIPLWYKAFNCAFALAVCASTLFLKQHCIPDVLAGPALAEVCWFLAARTQLYRPVERVFALSAKRK